MAARIGIDTGGTFTDVVRHSPRGVQVHKLPSTPDDPSRAVLAGLAATRRHPDEAVDLVHGTTVGLNAVLTGRLARTLFVTNQDFEDLIEIGRQERRDLYALAPTRTMPPVPRELRLGVKCRRGADAEVITALAQSEILRVVAAARRLRPEAIAIGLLHAPVDPTDEQRLAKALQRAFPDVPVTCSAAVAPVLGEYERFCAAILNAAIAPVVGRYTARLQAGLGAGRLRLLRSSLGIMPPDEAAQFPARAMFSGPAGGVLAAEQLARRLELPAIAAFDMGGTSADLCLVQPGNSHDEAGSIGGLPLPIPTVPVHTVGCGGGSIAYADAGGALRVGPQSAGAWPGPACYGNSEEPTVTDAHLVLGHLGADSLLGGRFPVDVGAAVRAIERLGRQLGLDAKATAQGILTIADATMARAILVVTAERAIDPQQVPLVAYGGAGGLHAAALARHLGMPQAIVPQHPGAFSALGLALAGESVEVARSVHCSVGKNDLQRLAKIGRELAAQAVAGIATRARCRVEALVRYAGQGAALRLPIGAKPATGLARRFAIEHERRFGFRSDAELEVVQVLARAETTARALPTVTALVADTTSRAESVRRAPVGGAKIRVLARTALHQGSQVVGPATIEESTATTLVPRNCVATIAPHGIVLQSAARR